MEFRKLNIADSDNELSHFARALALPVRISIVRILIINGTWVGPDVFSELKLGAVTVDKHLRAMIHLNIIKEKHCNRKAYYCLNDDVFLKISNEFNALFNFWNSFRTGNL